MLLRLDPYGRHTSGAIDQVTSLRATWETAADVRKKLISPPPVPDKLLALAASAEANRNRSSSYYFNNRSTDRVSVPEPGERVEQLDVVKAIIQMMDETLSL